MATAADHKIIIEKYTDFKIDLRVTIDGINAYNLGPTESNDGITNTTGYTPKMYLMYNNSGVVNYVKSDGTSAGTTKTAIYSGSALADSLDGNFSVILDDAVTDLLNPVFSGTTEVLTNNPFATEYNYFYSIDLENATAAPLDIKVVRGKAAIRE